MLRYPREIYSKFTPTAVTAMFSEDNVAVLDELLLSTEDKLIYII